MARLGGGLARLDPRRVRFHDLSVDHGADREGVPSPARRCHLCVHRDAVAAFGGRHGIGVAGRSGRAEIAADDLDPLVLDLQLHRRFFTELLVSVPVSRAARHRDGRGMAGRRCARDGILANPLARLYERGAAGLVGPRLCAIERRLRFALRGDRLARPFMARRAARLGRPVGPQIRQGARDLEAKPGTAASAEAGSSPAAD